MRRELSLESVVGLSLALMLGVGAALYVTLLGMGKLLEQQERHKAKSNIEYGLRSGVYEIIDHNVLRISEDVLVYLKQQGTLTRFHPLPEYEIVKVPYKREW